MTKITKTRLFCLVTAIVLLVCVIGRGILAINQQPDDYSPLLSQMRSDQWQQRANAVQQILSKPIALQSDQVKKSLIDLLERENQLIEDTLRESDGEKGVSVKYGEEYSEYYSGLLLDTVEKAADYSDKHTLEVLIHSAYNPTSPFALKLASYGEAVIPSLLERADSDVGVLRVSAIGLLRQIISKYGGGVSESTSQKIKKVLLKGVSDPSPIVQIEAIQALGEVGDKDALPLLEKIAPLERATYSSKSFLQEKAIEAIKAIRQREPSKQ